MKRFALLVAVVIAGFASQASAAPGDAELDAWRARWMDADFKLQLRYNPNIFDSYLNEYYRCKQELRAITQAYPATAAAAQGNSMLQWWNFMPRGIGIRDTSYVPVPLF